MRIFAPTMTLSAALIFGLSGSVAMAQDQPAAGAPPPGVTSQAPPSDAQPNHAPNPKRQAKRMARRLGLTSEQQSEIEPILADRQQQLENVHADTTLAPRDRRAKVREILQDSDSKVEAILSDAQKQQYEQMKQERRANRQTRGQQQTDAPPTANNP